MRRNVLLARKSSLTNKVAFKECYAYLGYCVEVRIVLIISLTHLIGGEYRVIAIQRFGNIIRERRRQLDLTQEEVARRIGTSIPYVGHLESSKRHPSEKVVIKLAKVLGLDARDLFFLANPGTKVLVAQRPRLGEASAWDVFSRDTRLRRVHNITDAEMELLSEVAMMGEVRSPRDFIFILNTIRHALGK